MNIYDPFNVETIFQHISTATSANIIFACRDTSKQVSKRIEAAKQFNNMST